MKERTGVQKSLWWNINYWIQSVCDYINNGYIVLGEKNSFSDIAHDRFEQLLGMTDILYQCQLISKEEREEVWDMVQMLDWEIYYYTKGVDLFVEEEVPA